MIAKQKRDHAVDLLCRLIEISPSSYYRWEKGGRARQQQDEQLKEEIKSSYERSRGTYGSARIVKDLRKRGIRVGKNRVARLMKEEGLQGCYNKAKKPTTTDSKHSQRISKNLLNEQPFPERARAVVVTDTTYVWTDRGWYYLASVMDLYTREILGWAFSDKNDRHLVCQALWAASDKLRGHESIIHHSDRGSTYCSDNYRDLLEDLGLLSSMSAKGYCYDNAHMESFFGSLKCECLELQMSLSPEEVKLALFDYIEGFYNTHRIHSSLEFMSPEEFYQQAATPMGVINGS